MKNFRIKKTLKTSTLNGDPENNEPYVRKRIKQNLKNISFDDDSDEDVEWNKNSMKNTNPDFFSDPSLDLLPRKVLPKRQVAPSNMIINDDSDDA